MDTAIREEVRIWAGPVALEGVLELPSACNGVVVFSHGSGSGRNSPRNNYVAGELRRHALGTLLLDLLTREEERIQENRFDIALANSNDRPTHRFAPEWQGKTSVVPLDAKDSPLPLRTADVINPDNPLRHAPAKLARALMRLLEA